MISHKLICAKKTCYAWTSPTLIGHINDPYIVRIDTIGLLINDNDKYCCRVLISTFDKKSPLDNTMPTLVWIRREEIKVLEAHL